VFRTAVILRDLEDLSYEEVAEVWSAAWAPSSRASFAGAAPSGKFSSRCWGDQELHAPSRGVAPSSAHGSMVEPQPSPFGDAYTAARRVNDFFTRGFFTRRFFA